MSKFYDRLEIQDDTIAVYQNTVVDKIKNHFLFALIPICIFFSGVLIYFANTPIKYLSIPGSILLIVYYKFVYMKIAEFNECKLFANSSAMKYRTEFNEYVIPFSSVKSVEDKSQFYDFSGYRNRGWNHLLIIHIKNGASVIKASKTGTQQRLAHSDIKDGKISIYDINLSHTDHQCLAEFIYRHISQVNG